MFPYAFCQFLWDVLTTLEEDHSDDIGTVSIMDWIHRNYSGFSRTDEGWPVLWYRDDKGLMGDVTIRDLFPTTYAEEGGMVDLCFVLERESEKIFNSLEGEARKEFKEIMGIALPNLRINLRHEESDSEAMIREDLFGTLGI